MARLEESPPPLASFGRRRRTEQQRQRRIRRIAIVAGLLTLVLALSIPVVGYYIVFMRPLHQTALVVNDVAYSWGDYLTRTRMLIAEAQATGSWQPDSLNGVVFDMLDEMERQEIVRQYAPQEGLTVTPEEVQREVRVRILGQARADDPSVPESEFQERYRRQLGLLKVSAAEYESIKRASVLRRKFEEYLKERVPAKAVHRRLFVIQAADLEAARGALDRIDGGEDFAQVARAVSRDPKAQESGGDWGWLPQGVKEEMDPVLLSLKDGEVTGPIFGLAGVYIVKAVGEPELRDVSEDDRSSLKARALDSWLAQRRAELAVKGVLQRPNGGVNTSRYNWILNQLAQDRELFPRSGASG
ncbi:MAG: peptidylprolyl isomerase [Chloroflexi bacterium]|nr:peptidylprolyl isomerase [Chloroflexota bacterium]